MSYTILISGANSGLGLSLLERYLSRPDTTVIATVRDPTKQQSLHDIPKASGSKLIIVKVESRSDTDALEAVSSISNQGINHLDVVIANAGYYTPPADPKVAKITAKDLLEHVDVNTAGPIRLFQATLPLLQKAEKPIFAYMSSMAGSIGATGDVPFSAGVYGASKAASNFLVRRAHAEHPELIIFAMHPGAVATVGALKVVESMGMADLVDNPDVFTTLEKSTTGMVERIDTATREETSGKFLSFDGSALPW
ncbi:nor-1 [Aureobasidium namibiae CBS 147.97]|uniref:Nor-1 n=1 Tax=Aureobasidium namibiae CBS 147.97 TaxID=1043004 RepID=A0A074WZG6_9PEZI